MDNLTIRQGTDMKLSRQVVTITELTQYCHSRRRQIIDTIKIQETALTGDIIENRIY